DSIGYRSNVRSVIIECTISKTRTAQSSPVRFSARNATMEWPTLTYEQVGPVGSVWLNRPERRNALNQQALEDLADLFGRLKRAFEVRVIVLGGRGRSFSAGADLKDPPGVVEMGDPTRSVRERQWFSELGTRAIEAIERVDAITIARVQGHAI